MRWLIKNPAPSDSRRMKWGDYHFGRSLSKYLVRMGHEVETQYDPNWGEDAPCDVVLVLRGKYPFPADSLHDGALRVMWNISHPADVSLDEYDSFDLVFVASRAWANRLRPLVSVPVRPLLQCTDLEEFDLTPLVDEETRRDFVFVGNTRDAERPGVLWAIDYGLPLMIWGRGWNQWDAGHHVVGHYFPNEDLGSLYARSRATLNDHWGDMSEFGFINNRIIDALACGLPVVSDWHEELQSLFPQGVLFYRDRQQFEQCIETLLLGYPQVLENVREAAETVRREFSFEHRASELSEMVARTAGVVRRADR